MGTFEYEQLDLKSSAFRLVRLLAGGIYKETIECELIYTSLDRNDFPYEAVSYTWGSSVRSSSIRLQGCNFSVTSNLWNLLHDLRQAETDRYLWIDAISINQDDDLERGHQVRRMQAIYSGAECVLFYLGESTQSIDTFIHSLTVLQRHTLGYRWEPDDARWQTAWEKAQLELQACYDTNVVTIQQYGLRELLERPWFRRVWILQEVASARKALLCCGRTSIPAPVFAMSPSLLNVRLGGHSMAVFKLMPGHSRKALRKPKDGALYQILADFHDSDASEPRDRIFALLGLCADPNVWETIAPDYTKTELDIVRAAIAYITTKGLGPPPKWIFSVDVPSIRPFCFELTVSWGRDYEPPVYIKQILIHILSFWDPEAVQDFIDRESSRVTATREFIDAAASNTSHALGVLSVLLQHAWISFDKSFLRIHKTMTSGLSADMTNVYFGVHNHLLKQLYFVNRIAMKGRGEVAMSIQRNKLYYLLSHASGGYLRDLILQLRDSDKERKLWDMSNHDETEALENRARQGLTHEFEEWAFFTIIALNERTPEDTFSFKYARSHTRDKNIALYFAMYHRHCLATRCLLSEGATIVIGQLPNPLSLAVHRKDDAILDVLRDYPASIVGRGGRRALHCAVELETVPVIRFLLGLGADPDAVDRDGRTALQVARDNGRPGVMCLLKAVSDGTIHLHEVDTVATEVAEVTAVMADVNENYKAASS
ncbi:heterokaryon incompatibility protein-domain-containing protein [Xylaria cf. heliscus]|nr:heterokaryon incompatibility protein-domain-containing protein [Xylaria cf. heliscus]